MLGNHEGLFLARSIRAAALHSAWVGGGDGRRGRPEKYRVGGKVVQRQHHS